MSILFPNPKIQQIIDGIVAKARATVLDAEKNIDKNKIDPFSALIDSMVQGVSLQIWLQQEKSRQSQKTLQNCIGEFHQHVIASFDGWEDLGTGNVADVRCKGKRVVAEVKNKFNTTKGNHKVQIYRDLEAVIAKPEYQGFTGYYVEIIPSGKGSKAVYDQPFTPSDNVTKKRVAERADIRRIDGRSFYALVTGQHDALEQLYKSLPAMIRTSLKEEVLMPEADALFDALFQKAFG